MHKSTAIDNVSVLAHAQDFANTTLQDRFTAGMVALIGGRSAATASVRPDPQYLLVREGPQLSDGSTSAVVVMAIKLYPTNDVLDGSQLFRQLQERTRYPAFMIESGGIQIIWKETQRGPPADCSDTAELISNTQDEEINWR